MRNLFSLLSLWQLSTNQSDGLEAQALHLVEAILKMPADQLRQRYQKTAFNPAALLARLLRQWPQVVASHFSEIVELAGWHLEVLQAVEHAFDAKA
jgi:hypothetical protein